MDDIVSWVRSGDSIRVRQWLDDPRHDPAWTDEHRFSLLHWAAWGGHLGLAEMLASRSPAGSVDVKNAGNDTPLHVAASHGHVQLVRRLLQLRAAVDATNEHGNTPLHYACFNNYPETALELLMAAAVNQIGVPLGRENRYGQAPIDLARPSLAVELRNAAASLGLDPERRQPWLSPSSLCSSTLLSRQQSQASAALSTENFAELAAVDQRGPLSPMQPASSLTGPPTLLNRQVSQQLSKQLRLIRPMSAAAVGSKRSAGSGFVRGAGGGRSELWLGVWLGDQAVAEAQVAVRVYRLVRNTSADMAERVARLRRELALLAPRLRVFNCAQVQPLLAASVVDGSGGGGGGGGSQLMLVSGYVQFGSLYWLLHEERDRRMELDRTTIAKFAWDIANGMDYLSRMDPPLSCYQLNSKSVVLDDNLTAKLSLSCCRFPVGLRGQQACGIQQRQPAWLSPESLISPAEAVNTGAAHMWSYGVLLWELGTRQVPFGNWPPMEIGIKVAREGLRLPMEELVAEQKRAAASTQSEGAARWMERLVAMATNESPGARPRFESLLPILGKIVLAAERATGIAN